MLKLSLMLERGTPAPDFSLFDTMSGETRSLADFDAYPALLVAFISNGCPFVHHLMPAFTQFACDYADKGLKVVAISSNDADAAARDSTTEMRKYGTASNFDFPYLYDEDQQVALAYSAVCTPDFFLFDQDRRLFYTGQFCSSRPPRSHAPLDGWTSNPPTGADLRRAVDALLTGRSAPVEQRPSAGCSIKWKAENMPSWG